MNNEMKICDVEIKKVQAHLLSILAEFDRICRKNGIRYSVEGGTLIGAVKYGGFVPWDDDIDVVMLREDYERFLSACEVDLGDNFFLQNSFTDPNFPLSYSKLRLNNSSYVQKNYEHLNINHGLFIDITPLDYVKRRPSRIRLSRIAIHKGARDVKLGLIGNPIRRHARVSRFKLLAYKLASVKSLASLNSKINSIQISKRKTEWLYNLTNPLRGEEPVAACEFDEYVDIDFGGLRVMAIKDYEKMIRRLFGDDYMSVEPDPLTRGPSHAITDCRLPSSNDNGCVGIVTYHRADNYGAVLQTYALCRAIRREVGVPCEVIDYKCEAVESLYRPKKIRDVKHLKTKLKLFLINKWRCKDRAHFQSFRRAYIPMSASCDAHSIGEIAAKYTTVVSGSDQVWNDMLNGSDRIYLLSFADRARRVSYAASAGAEKLWLDNIDCYRPYLDKFDAISVRESGLHSILRENGYSDVRLVCDPVFLLDRDDYKPLESNAMLVKGDYILVYVVASERSMLDFSRELSRRTGKPLVIINTSSLTVRGMKNLREVPVGHFLSLIKNAAAVVTSSFHGFAFSALYNTDVYYCLSSCENNFNSRMNTLAERLGLCRRNIATGLNNVTPIDWEAVNNRIREMRAEGIEFLKESIQ